MSQARAGEITTLLTNVVGNIKWPILRHKSVVITPAFAEETLGRYDPVIYSCHLFESNVHDDNYLVCARSGPLFRLSNCNIRTANPNLVERLQALSNESSAEMQGLLQSCNGKAQSETTHAPSGGSIVFSPLLTPLLDFVVPGLRTYFGSG
jgi:hypothetical protein